METALTSASKANDYIRTRLGRSPSIGLLSLMTDLIEVGLPVRVHDQTGLQSGSAQVRREGIDLRLADGPFSEGVIAHEAVTALLETQGWPRLFGEAATAGTRHYLERLIGILDRGSGIALQRRYALEGDGHELAMITAQWRRMVQLNRQKDEPQSPPLSENDRIAITLDAALSTLDHRLRAGSTPVPFLQAMATFSGARPLYDQMLQASGGLAPATGWQARRLLRAMIEGVDGYLERVTGSRPLQAASQIVPSLHPEDSARTVSQVMTIVETPPAEAQAGTVDLRLITNRDGLAFSCQERFTTAAQAETYRESVGQENYAAFVRAKVPHAMLIWRPTGE